MKRYFAWLLAILTGCTFLSAKADSSPLRLYAVNVRKADCLLLEYRETRYLVDTGSPESVPQMIGFLRNLGVSRLDGVILTHTDDDHGGGLAALCASGITVDALYTSAFWNCKDKKHPALTASARYGIPLSQLRSGDTLPFSDGSLNVLGPISRDTDAENCNSLVLLAEAAGSRILLAGDMEFPEEEALLDAGLISEADLIKIGNHGENDATSDALIAAVRPRAAIISTNSSDEPDTPAKRVLKLLKNRGARIFLTENTPDGILAELSGDEILVDSISPRPEADLTGVRLSRKDPEADLVTLFNSSTVEADLSGWFLISEKGNEVFFFPEGTVLLPGSELTVGTLSSPAFSGLIWEEKNAWHNSKADAAVLYDALGRETDRLE